MTDALLALVASLAGSAFLLALRVFVEEHGEGPYRHVGEALVGLGLAGASLVCGLAAWWFIIASFIH